MYAPTCKSECALNSYVHAYSKYMYMYVHNIMHSEIQNVHILFVCRFLSG